MSADSNGSRDMAAVCASCGIAEVDEIKLKDCDGCDLFRYCSDECQIDHELEHKEACKKRAAELRDELLFKKPESSHLGDCPLCCLPLPLDISKCTMNNCCSKFICRGCAHADMIREYEGRLIHSCEFCRKPTPETEEGSRKQRMKRVKANDPVALCHEGMVQYNKGEYIKAFEYYEKAASLGDIHAQYLLAGLYGDGEGVEKDREKFKWNLEEAAIGGHPHARYLIGLEEVKNGNIERAVKHWIIAATQGYDSAIKMLMTAFKEGDLSKEDLAATLRAHKAAVDATKSPQRRAAEEFYKNKN